MNRNICSLCDPLQLTNIKTCQIFGFYSAVLGPQALLSSALFFEHVTAISSPLLLRDNADSAFRSIRVLRLQSINVSQAVRSS